MSHDRQDVDLTDEQRRMVADNLGLCGWAVNRWFRFLPPEGAARYNQADAMQDAVFGLARAAQLFDPARGYKFSTYATARLRKAIQEGIGRHEGINFRRVHRSDDRSVTDLDRAMATATVLSLDHETVDGFQLADMLADPASLEAEAETLLLLTEVHNSRDRVCRDDTDRLIFDAMTDLDEHRARTVVLAELAPTAGMTMEALRRRWLRIQDKLRACCQVRA